jgi:hypothetical protein
MEEVADLSAAGGGQIFANALSNEWIRATVIELSKIRWRQTESSTEFLKCMESLSPIAVERLRKL